jgi:hypothetical protein
MILYHGIADMRNSQNMNFASLEVVAQKWVHNTNAQAYQGCSIRFLGSLGSTKFVVLKTSYCSNSSMCQYGKGAPGRSQPLQLALLYVLKIDNGKQRGPERDHVTVIELKRAFQGAVQVLRLGTPGLGKEK